MLEAYSPAIAAPVVDLEHPAAARVYDFLLGGSANWAIDRDFGRRALQYFPQLRDMALTNRLFLRRAVRHLTRLGVRQFLDISSGVLSKGNTHQFADEINPDSRVIYGENEAVAVAHAEALLDEEGDPDRHAVINVGFHWADELWGEALATGIFDLTEPVAVLMLSALHSVRPGSDEDDVDVRLMARYRQLLPVGSYLCVAHVTDDGIPWELVPKLLELKHLCHEWLHCQAYSRSRHAIRALLGDFRLVPPGMAWTPEWHPEEGDSAYPFAATPNYAAVWAGVGQKVK